VIPDEERKPDRAEPAPQHRALGAALGPARRLEGEMDLRGEQCRNQADSGYRIRRHLAEPTIQH
jgi:hypothetical protein